ncbi:MAG: threonylcarbamoyl-AMP synthase [Candidatus Wildermuthbacteria bacterium]|nr:threonylcarbamoyl-AMP synthase [Candidatus Wildermuthbacteria bacterium]
MQIWKLERGERFARKAVSALKKGKVLVCPTDTVYGLLADAANKKAVQRVFEIKKRGAGKPLPLFIRDMRMAKKLAHISKDQELFLKKVWPGKVTAVLESKISGTVGVRIPNHPLVLDLLKIFQKPLTGTSANITGKEPARSVEEIVSQFAKKKYKPDVVIDAGTLRFSKPSKVVDLTGKKKKILRP